MTSKKLDIFKAAVLAAGLGAILVSCRKDERPNRLSFCTITEATKVVTGEGSSLTTTSSMKVPGQNFKVYATYRQGSSNVNVFANQPETITYNTSLGGSSEEYYWRYYSDGKWEYWKPSADYKFRAVYPGDKVELESGSSSSQIMVDYKTGVIGAPDNYDLAVAYAERNPSIGGYGPINLTFKHALSAIKIKAKYKNTVPLNDKLTVLFLRNLVQSATMFYSGSEGVTDIDWSNNQGINYSDKLYYWSDTEGVDFSDTVTAPAFGDKYIFAIPQTIETNQAAVYFQTLESGKIVNLGYLPAITWLPGKIYDYTLIVSGTRVDVEVSIHPWTEFESENDVIIK